MKRRLTPEGKIMKQIPTELTCKVCKKTAQLDCFAVDRRHSTGHKRLCKPCAAARTAKYERSNPDKIRAKYLAKREAMLLYRKKIRARNRALVLNAYGNCCACCGESEPKFLAVDHINNDGAAHRKELGIGGDNFYAWIIKNSYPADLQLLCHNCNFAKGLYGACPHQEKAVRAA